MTPSACRRVAHERAEPAAAVAAADVERPPLQPADHVEVHHPDGAIERDRGTVHVVARADQAQLLGAEEREDQGAAGATGRGECARQPEDHRGAGAIVVGARVHDAVDAAEVIVVRADHDGFGGERGSTPGRMPMTFAARVSSVTFSTRMCARVPVANGAGTRAADRARVTSAIVRPAGARTASAASRVTAPGEQADLDRRLVRRREIVAHDQQRGGAASRSRDQLVQAPYTRARQLRRRAIERERDLSTNVDTGVVVVGGVGDLDSVADEDDLAADLAGERAAVGDPVTPSRASVRSARAGQAARRTGTRGRLEDEGLQKRSCVSAGPEPRGGEPVGEPSGGMIATRCARPAAVHLRRGQGIDALGEGRGLGRYDRRPRGRAGRRDDQEYGEEKCDETADHMRILLYLDRQIATADLTSATRPPVMRTRSAGVSLKTVFGWPAAAQISDHRSRSSSIRIVSGSACATGGDAADGEARPLPHEVGVGAARPARR